MRGDLRAVAAVTTAAALLLTACDGDAGPQPIPPSETGETSPSEEPEPAPEPDVDDEVEEEASAEVGVDTIPDDPADIDEAYVQRVLDALDPALGEAIQRFVAAGEPDEATIAALSQVYTSDLLAQRLSGAFSPGAVDDYLPDADGPRSEVLEVRVAGGACIDVAVERDVTGMFVEPGDPRRWVLALVPEDGEGARGAVAWRLQREQLDDEGEGAPRELCAEEGLA